MPVDGVVRLFGVSERWVLKRMQGKPIQLRAQRDLVMGNEYFRKMGVYKC